MKKIRFELDVEYEDGHSPYICDVNRRSDTTVLVSCDPNMSYADWNSRWARYPSANIPTETATISLPVKKKEGQDGITSLIVAAPSSVELDSFTAVIDLNGEVMLNEEPLSDENLKFYEGGIKEILKNFVDKPSDLLF